MKLFIAAAAALATIAEGTTVAHANVFPVVGTPPPECVTSGGATVCTFGDYCLIITWPTSPLLAYLPPSLDKPICTPLPV